MFYTPEILFIELRPEYLITDAEMPKEKKTSCDLAAQQNAGVKRASHIEKKERKVK